MLRIKLLMACALLFLVTPGIAREKLVIGRDARLLDADESFQFFGKVVYLDDIGTEDLDHDFGLIEELSGISPTPFVVRRSIGLRNGFAVIKNNIRWIVYDPTWYGGGRAITRVLGN